MSDTPSPSAGRGWMTPRCDHYLISLPYPYGPDFEVCAWDETAHARILWLLPITKAEKDYRREQGLEELESLFDERAINPVDPQRPSVVLAPRRKHGEPMQARQKRPQSSSSPYGGRPAGPRVAAQARCRTTPPHGAFKTSGTAGRSSRP
ncbi:suppressor of fused domain protein [Streptomyces sp. NPDC096032]|uniref:suppressor of fused domain protein n=1 Tax=Streptomyces sp. NPDC096032 TaxID=3366070 RepID=UPI003807C1BA